MTTNPPKITFGEMRESGVRDVLIYCREVERYTRMADRARNARAAMAGRV